jgi:23S rRNA (guanine2445-N2)-methyltransferase / 23S rRNA (guanine2069-N7)-methyltransferase
MTAYHHYFVTCPRGVEDLLAQECEAVGITQWVQTVGGIEFSAELENAYRLCLWSRLASRVLLRLSTFDADDYDELYAAAGAVDWSQHMDVHNSFAIDCFTAHEALNNSHFATLRVKDAVVDQFIEQAGERPNIERDTPDIRINVYIGKHTTPAQHNAALYLDLAGQPLHVRGYRQHGGDAPLKENLAAAILLRCKWPNVCTKHGALFDPMCGSASFLIEAAYMAINRAPGVLRDYYGFLGWKQHSATLWASILEQARAAEHPLDSLPALVGCDVSAKTLSIAQANVNAAGFENHITLHAMDSLEALPELPVNKGLVLCNPPYGKRLGDVRELKQVYYRLGRMFKQQFAGWEAAVFTADEELARTIGLRAHHKNTLYNGALKCGLYQYHLRAITGAGKQPQPVETTTPVVPRSDNAQMFENRLRKNLKHLGKWARRNTISCYRLYDADQPQYAMAIDIYGSQVHVQEYEAPAEIDDAKTERRLHEAVEIIAEVLGLPQKAIVTKTRKKQSGSEQYIRQDETGRTRIVEEQGLRFVINLHDYLDTGLFLDHRLTRLLIARLAANRRFLNLFAYTGTASVFAASGGAASTTTVDMSNTYLEWAQDNMALNNFSGSQHGFERADCLQWLWDAWKAGRRFELVFLDPPTFSNSKKMQQTFDVGRDHVELIQHTMRILDDDGMLIFSTNAKRFKLDITALDQYQVFDLTALTTSEDFRRRPAHKCWAISRAPLTLNWTELLR